MLSKKAIARAILVAVIPPGVQIARELDRHASKRGEARRRYPRRPHFRVHPTLVGRAGTWHEILHTLPRSCDARLLQPSLERAGDKLAACTRARGVVSKKTAAIAWCQRASDYTATTKGKPWRYALIPHTAIAANMTLRTVVETHL